MPVASSTTEGGAGAADSAQVFYTGTAVSSKAYTIIGYASYETGLVTAGSWAAAPTRIQLYGANVPLPGATIQMQQNTDGAVATGTTATPVDDTIPQNTEGDQFMSQAITPTSAANLLEIIHVGNYGCNSSQYLVSALHQDSTANALAAVHSLVDTVSGTIINTVNWWMVAGTTSSTTFKIRTGAGSSVIVTFNGFASNRKFGGIIASILSVREIAV